MITIKGYTQVNYPVLQNILKSAFENSGKTPVQVAADINVKSAETARNAFKEGPQVVSDEVLTNAMRSVDIDGMVLWISGQKYYYLSSKIIKG